MATAPWWATGVFTIAGVLIAQVVTALLSRRQNRFEDSRRWHEERKELYLSLNSTAWEVEEAIFNHWELDEPLPENLEELDESLEVIKRKIELIASEEVRTQAVELLLSGHSGITATLRGQEGTALNACDSMRHRLYYLTDLMRAELTANPAAVRRWHRRPARRRQAEARAKLSRMAVTTGTWVRNSNAKFAKTDGEDHSSRSDQ